MNTEIKKGVIVKHFARKRNIYYVTETPAPGEVKIRRTVKRNGKYTDAGDKTTYRATPEDLTVVGEAAELATATPPRPKQEKRNQRCTVVCVRRTRTHTGSA